MKINTFTPNFKIEENGFSDTENFKSFTSEEKTFNSFRKMIEEENPELNYTDEGSPMGTDNLYKHFLNKLVYTDGVRNFAIKHNAYWLLDVIESYADLSMILSPTDKNGSINFTENKRGIDSFIICTIYTDGKKAYFSMDFTEEEKTLVFQKIPYTDLNVKAAKFYIENGVILTPNER